MDGLIATGVLLVLALPVMAVAAFVMVIGLRRRVRVLEARLAALEAGAPLTSPASASATPAEPAPVAATQTAVEPEPEPEPEFQSEAEAGAPAETPSPQPKPPRESLEQRLGARWAVWVGGLALALGAIFLVRYSIDAGLIGPGLRIVLGVAFSLALLGAGEVLRRSRRIAAFSVLPAANVPAILTAAGTVGLFASIYAAYELYALIGPLACFLLLAAVGLGTMAAAALHGPWLSGLGLVGAHAAPALVASANPDTAILAVYLVIVTTAAFFLDAIRSWRWLMIAAALGAIGWGFLMLGLPGSPITDALYALALAALTLAFVLRRETEAGRPDLIATAILAGLAAVFVAGATAHGYPASSIIAALLAVALMLAAAWRFDTAAFAAPVAAALLLGLLFLWPAAQMAAAEPTTYIVDGVTEFFPLPDAIADFASALGVGILLLVGTALLLSRRALPPHGFTVAAITGAAVAGPLLALAIAYLRLSGFASNPLIAAVTAALAAFYAIAANRAAERERPESPDDAITTGFWAAGAVAGLAFALTMLLSGGILTTAFALASLGTAFVETRRPIVALRYAILALAAVVFARLVYDPSVFGIASPIGIYASILVGYGVPALAFAGAATLLRRRAVDRPALAAEGVAITLAALLVIFEIRAITFGGNLTAPETSLAEQGLDTAAAFAFALGLTRLGERRRSPVFGIAGLIARALGLVAAVFSLGIALNPLLTGTPVAGSALFNEIVLAYGLPAALAALLAAIPLDPAAGPWRRGLRAATGLVALGLAFLGVSLEIRFLFAGPDLSAGTVGSAESYTYSAVWLGFGLLLLLGGLLRDAKAARIASALVILAAVLKVFLIDMANLEGIWRALSFMGLGLVLIGIGLLYQRLLFGAARAAGPPAD